MGTNNIPRKTKARHATAQSPLPVLGSAAACVVAGLVFLVVLVAGVLMDAGAGLASDLGDGSGMGGRDLRWAWSDRQAFLRYRALYPREIATSGLTGTGLGLPRRRLGACGFNYHMLCNGPTGVHPGSVHNKLAIGGVHAKEAAVLARSAASSNNTHAAEPGPETPGSS